jgi:hypothetical protein
MSNKAKERDHPKTLPEEWRRNIGLGGIGKIPWNKGKKNCFSKEVNEIRRRKMLGKKNSLGYHQTEKTLELMRINRKGSKNARAKKVINTETGKIYGCIKDVLIDYPTNYSTFTQKLSGKRKNNTNFKYL